MDVNKEISRKRWELSNYKNLYEFARSELGQLHALKRKNDGKKKIILRDRDLAYAFQRMLIDQSTAKDVLRKCASALGKPLDWHDRVYEYVISENQVKTAMDILKRDSNEQIALLECHELLNIRDLSKLHLSTLLLKVKALISTANKIEKKQTKIDELTLTVQELQKELELTKTAMEKVETLTTERRIKLALAQYPNESIARIARIANVSRNSVYKYKQ